MDIATILFSMDSNGWLRHHHLASVRSWLHARGYDRDAHQIQSDHIAVRELGKEEEKPRLVLNENKHPTLSDCGARVAKLLDRERVESAKTLHPSRRLFEAILFCRSKVEEIASANDVSQEKAAEQLLSWSDTSRTR